MGNIEKRDRSFIEHTQDGYCEIDLAGTFTYVNPASCDIFGYPKSELIGLNYREYTDQSNARRAFQVFNEIYRTGVPGKLFDYELTGKDGVKRQVEVFASLIKDQSGQPAGFRGTVRDVTAQKQMEGRLRESEERYRSIVEDMEDAYFELDLKGRFTFVNEALCRNLGYTRDEIIGVDNRQYAGKKTTREMYRLFNRVFKTGVPVKAHAFELFRKDGGKIYTEISVSLIRNKEGAPVGFRGIARDITERREYEEQIRHLATHDVLTGLPNRIMFREVLQQNIDFAQRYEQKFALFFMDLDGFKIINDTFGHEIGDQMLIECAARMRRALRASDFIARLGGDEFVILVRNVTSKDKLITTVNKILAAVRQPIAIQDRKLYFTASIGISIFPRDGHDSQSLAKSADMAMYAAKEKGSNGYEFFSLGIESQMQEKSTLEEQLSRALGGDEIFLEYQPKLDLKTGAITGVEALVRWRSPSLGLVSPGRLIPVAESSGLIIPLGRRVLKTACLQNMAWRRRGLPGIGVSVNLSHQQLMDDRLMDDLREALEESGMEPGLLELEVTERLLMTYFPHIINVMTQLKDLGVRLALDDYGSGYSSITQIRRLPVDTLKIDGEIICNIPHSNIDMAIVQAITGIGKALGLNIVAEGIETPAQLAFVRDSRCDMAQGFFFSRPLLPDRIAELLQTWDRGNSLSCPP